MDLGTPDASSTRRRFDREVFALEETVHQGVAAFLGAGTEDQLAYIAMEFISGRTLLEVIDSANGKAPASLDPVAALPDQRVRSIVQAIVEIASTLHDLERKFGVLHGDLKPSNLMLTNEGRTKVVDFGFARRHRPDGPLSLKSGFEGTPQYAAPEMLLDPSKRPTEASDVYSLGATMHALLFLKSPFDSCTDPNSILTAALPIERSRPAWCPDSLAAILVKSLDPEISHRYGTMEEFGNDLKSFLEGRPVGARLPSPLRRLTRLRRRNPKAALWTLVGGAALLAIIALTLLLWSQRESVRLGNEVRRAQHYDSAIEEGYLALGENRGTHAIGIFQTALSINDRGLEATVGVLIAWIGLRKFEPALSFLDANPELEAKHPILSNFRRDAVVSARGEILPGSPDIEEEPRNGIEHFLVAERYLGLARGRSGENARRAYRHAHQAMLEIGSKRAIVAMEYARAAYLAGEDAAANEAAVILLRHWPESGEVLHRAGLVLSKSDPKRALLLCRRAHDLVPKSPIIATNLANALHRMGQKEDAARQWRHCISTFPESVTAWLQLFEVFISARQMDEALVLLEQARLTQPDSALKHALEGRLALAERSFGKAEVELTKSLELDPEVPLVRAWKGRVLARRKKYEAAEILLRDAMANSTSEDLIEDLASILVETKRESAAIEFLLKFQHDTQMTATSWCHLGRAQMALGRTSEADRSFQNAIVLDQEFAGAHLLRGQLAQVEKRHSDALGHFERAMSLAPGDAEIAVDVAIVLLEMGRPEEALLRLSVARTKNPRSAKLAHTQSNAFYKAGRLEEAIRAAEDCMRLDPKTYDAYLIKAGSLIAQNQPDLASQCLDEAIQIVPERANGADYALVRSQVFIGKGRFHEAQSWMEQIGDRIPRLREDRLATEADVHYGIGDIQGFRLRYHLMLVNDQGNPLAHAVLGRLAWLRGQKRLASLALQRALLRKTLKGLARSEVGRLQILVEGDQRNAGLPLSPPIERDSVEWLLASIDSKDAGATIDACQRAFGLGWRPTIFDLEPISELARHLESSPAELRAAGLATLVTMLEALLAVIAEAVDEGDLYQDWARLVLQCLEESRTFERLMSPAGLGWFAEELEPRVRALKNEIQSLRARL